MNKQKTVDSKVLAILRECPETRYDDMVYMRECSFSLTGKNALRKEGFPVTSILP